MRAAAISILLIGLLASPALAFPVGSRDESERPALEPRPLGDDELDPLLREREEKKEGYRRMIKARRMSMNASVARTRARLSDHQGQGGDGSLDPNGSARNDSPTPQRQLPLLLLGGGLVLFLLIRVTTRNDPFATRPPRRKRRGKSRVHTMF